MRRNWFVLTTGVLLGWHVSSRTPLPAQIETAGDLFVELDARHATAGTATWINTAPETIGDFLEVGDPVWEEIQGVPAVTFNATEVLDAYQSEMNAPAGLVGPDPTRSIEVWVYNSSVPVEETLVAWGRRGGPDPGTNMSFNYGTNEFFGAVGHWGAPDIGWDDAGGAPAAGMWHHLVYTFDGETTRVYADGCRIDVANCAMNSEVVGAGVVNTHPDTPVTLAAQIEPNGVDLNLDLRGTLSIARVRVHNGVLTPEQIQNNFDLECAEICSQPVPCDCENCPVGGDFLHKGSPVYVRLLRFRGTPPPTGSVVLDPPGATLLNGRLEYVLPDPEPESFQVRLECTNDDGSTSAFGWEVVLVDPPERGDVELAGELFVELFADDVTAGAPFWLNSGTLLDFVEVGDPISATLGPANSPAVIFNDTAAADAYQCLENAPEELVGLDPTRSIEVWAFNAELADEETLVAWGRRGGPDGTNMSFNYGTNEFFGAVGHWGAEGPDLGWDDLGGAPPPGQWHHLVYTYDGETTRVYADGLLENAEFLGFGAIDTWAGHPITLAAQNANAAGDLEFGTVTGTLALGQVRVHDGVLTPGQIRANFDLEREAYGVGPIASEPPEFLDAPRGDFILTGTPTYTRTLTVTGFPAPTLQAVLPIGAAVSPDGILTYDLPDPEPDSFVVTVRATNDSVVDATWTVTVIKPTKLPAGPVHRYSFTTNADDSVGGAHGTAVGGVEFRDGQVVLLNDGTQNSNGVGLFPDPLDPAKLPPGAYVDLPNGIVGALGAQATFEAWVTWNGPIGSSWQRIFDFGTSAGGEGVSDGAGAQGYFFLSPRSGPNTLRFAYRSQALGERLLDSVRLQDGSEQHVAVTWDETLTTATMYVNGSPVATDEATHVALSELVDDNNWLGRSQWPDAMFSGSYNEFRIYDYPLSANEVLGNFLAGPDTLNTETAPEICDDIVDNDGDGLADCDDPDCIAECQEGRFVRGDVNADAAINITDAIFLLASLFLGGPSPSCTDAADANDDSAVNITDAIYLLSSLFLGGPPPPAPVECGGDPSDDGLDCVSFAPCF